MHKEHFMSQGISRRGFVTGGVAALLGAVGIKALSSAGTPTVRAAYNDMMDHDGSGHGSNMMEGTVNHERNGFDPMQMLVDWDYGKVSTLANGQTLREYEFIAF